MRIESVIFRIFPIPMLLQVLSLQKKLFSPTNMIKQACNTYTANVCIVKCLAVPHMQLLNIVMKDEQLLLDMFGKKRQRCHYSSRHRKQPPTEHAGAFVLILTTLFIILSFLSQQGLNR